MEMNNIVENSVEKYTKMHRYRKILVPVLGICALIAVVFVFWQLHDVGTAITAYCDQEEHTHTDECYENVLICGLDEREAVEEHTHTEECYDEDGVLICSLEECEAVEGHIHTDECYEERLVCDIPEHVHTLECYSDPSADLETEAIWNATLPQLTGIWADDVANIAKSQIGYTESTNNYAVNDDGEKMGYTRYGDWYGNKYGGWNAMFVSFCIRNAGLTEEQFPTNSGTYAWIAQLNDIDSYVISDEYTPSVGDIAFISFADSADDAEIIEVSAQEDTLEDSLYSTADIIGVITDKNEDEDGNILLTVVIGDSNDAVEVYTFDTNEEKDKTLDSTETLALVGYGILPIQDIEESIQSADEDIEEVTDNDETEGAYETGVLTGENDYEYASKILNYDVNVEGSISIDSTSDEITWDDISMKVDTLDKDDSTYENLLTWAEDEGDGDFYDLSVVKISFFYKNEELDMSGCDVTVHITPTSKTIKNAMPEASEDDIIDMGIILTALEADRDAIETIDEITITADDVDNSALIMSLNENDTIAVAVSSTSNPNFTVEYFSYLPLLDMIEGDGATEFSVINTSGKVLPGNTMYVGEGSYNISYAELDSKNSNYEFKMPEQLTEIYLSDNYEYRQHPGVYYTDILVKNDDYKLTEIWVLKDKDKDPDDTTEDDWYIYNEKDDENNLVVDLTNKASEANETTIYVDDDTILRYVYDTTETTQTIIGNLYDYNITDGVAYTSASTSGGVYSNPNNLTGQAYWNAARASGTTYVYTRRQGINLASNYTGSGAMFAFGNANTATTLGSRTVGSNNTVLWTDLNSNTNLINRTNGYSKTYNVTGGGYGGAVFGLAKSVEDIGEGKLVFSDGVTAPDLFTTDDSVVGKKTFAGVDINFTKNGDVYTLSSIKGEFDEGSIDLENLGEFTHLTHYVKENGATSGSSFDIYTNNFWPLDNVSYEGMDPLFGKYDDSLGTSSLKVFNGDTTGDNGDSLPKDFSPSDDSIDHNSYFGMSLDIDFTLTSNYCGPLEYFFYGDDDLWIFLTPYTMEKKDTGEVTTLSETDSDIDEGQYERVYDYDNQQLILDIGGVHSSIGEYVNLWDYIDKGSEGSYVLSVYYTERGASGSSCSMCFALPSASSATPIAATGSMTVEKVLQNAAGEEITDSDKEFTFLFTLEGEDEEEIADECQYVVFNKSTDEENTDEESADEQVDVGVIHSGETFTLLAGQYVFIDYIPYGTTCTVEEQKADGYKTYCTVIDNEGNSTVISGTKASGEIVDDNTVSIVVSNSTSTSLPVTGGEGIYLYALMGLLLVFSAARMLYKKHKEAKA